MKLPGGDDVHIPPEKLTEYLLNPLHRVGQHKCWVLVRYGFRRDRPEVLDQSLRQHARSAEVVIKRPRGSVCLVALEGPLANPGGKMLTFLTVWKVRDGFRPSFVTARPVR